MTRAKTTTIEEAMRILSRDIVSDDGVARSACLEAAERLAELRDLLERAVITGGGTMSAAFVAKIKKAIA